MLRSGTGAGSSSLISSRPGGAAAMLVSGLICSAAEDDQYSQSHDDEQDDDEDDGHGCGVARRTAVRSCCIAGVGTRIRPSSSTTCWSSVLYAMRCT